MTIIHNPKKNFDKQTQDPIANKLQASRYRVQVQNTLFQFCTRLQVYINTLIFMDMWVFVSVIFLFIQLVTHSQALQVQPDFKLFMYITPQCRSCEYSARQIDSMIKEMHWEQKVAYEIINCNLEEQKNQCRDNANEPLLIITQNTQQMIKIAEVKGFRAYLYYRDWISQHINQNFELEPPIELEGYKVHRISSADKLLEKHLIETRRRDKIEKQKYDIIESIKQEIAEQAKKNPQSSQPQKVTEEAPEQVEGGKQTITSETKNDQQNKNENQFHRFWNMGTLAICISGLAYIAVKIINWNQSQYNQQRVTIPAEDIDDFD